VDINKDDFFFFLFGTRLHFLFLFSFGFWIQITKMKWKMEETNGTERTSRLTKKHPTKNKQNK